jgi:hypothetical protein
MTFSKHFAGPMLAILLFPVLSTRAQNRSLAGSIDTLAAPAQGHVGTFVLDLEAGDSCMTNAPDHFPMLYSGSTKDSCSARQAPGCCSNG